MSNQDRDHSLGVASAEKPELTNMIGFSAQTRLEAELSVGELCELCLALGCLSVQQIENSLCDNDPAAVKYGLSRIDARRTAEKVMLEIYPKIRSWCPEEL